MDAESKTPHASITHITTLLKTKDDTSRFVGLALLKSVLDNSEDLRENPEIISQLWWSISPKFLDRLFRSGGKKGDDSKHMLDIASSVTHTFAALLPEESHDERLVGRIPSLVRALTLR